MKIVRVAEESILVLMVGTLIFFTIGLTHFINSRLYWYMVGEIGIITTAAFIILAVSGSRIAILGSVLFFVIASASFSIAVWPPF